MKAKIDALADRCIPLSFSRVGFTLRKKIFQWDDDTYKEDLQNLHIAITGPTSGLGLAAAEELAKQGAKLYLLARNTEKASKLAQRLEQEHRGNPVLGVMKCDLADLQQVTEASTSLAKASKLDCLIHNGGGLHNKRKQSKDGLELTLATHVVAPHLLTTRILPLLNRSANPKVLTMSSGGMYSQKIQLNDLQTEKNYSGTLAYAKAKRAQVDLAQIWAKNHPTVGFHTVHPGWSRTPGLKASLPLFSKILQPFLRTPLQGVDTLLWLCATTPLPNGKFWFDRKMRATSYFRNMDTNEQDQQKLWTTIEQLASH